MKLNKPFYMFQIDGLSVMWLLPGREAVKSTSGMTIDQTINKPNIAQNDWRCLEN